MNIKTRLWGILISLALVLGLITGMKSTVWAEGSSSNQYSLSVRFTPSGDATNWEQAYCHYWENNSEGKLVPGHTTEWPGIAMTKNGNDWVLNITSEWSPTGIIFDVGSDQQQTEDLSFVKSSGDATAKNGGSYGTYTASISVAVTGVSLNKTSTTLTVGGTETLTATVEPSGATDKTVKWSVGGTDAGAVKLYSDADCKNEVGADATDVLTVYAKGMSGGTSTITVTTTDGSKTATCDVTVKEPLAKVKYLDASGHEQECSDYIVVTNETTQWGIADQVTWYVVKDNTGIDNGIKIANNANVHLILCDNATLSINSSTAPGISPVADDDAYNLTIYAQSTGNEKGLLNVTSTSEGQSSIGINTGGNVTINGGNITSKGTTYGIVANNVTINGGETTTTTNSSGQYAGILAYTNVAINGGEITSQKYATGIEATNNITIAGGTINVSGINDGIKAKNIKIDGGNITSNGLYAEKNDVSSEGGTLTITGGEITSTTSGNSAATYSSGNLEISGGKVTTDGLCSATGAVSITDGVLITTSSKVAGISSQYDLSISGGTITATATGKDMSAITSSYGNISISGGTVTATGKRYGIHKISEEKSLTISGGNVTAIGDTSGIDKAKNTIPGIGWTNTEGTQGKADIDDSETEKDLTSYKKVQFPAVIVTYKIVNGTWSDDTTADKTENVGSGSKPTSVPSGMKAAEGYAGGSWSTNPAETTITEATTFTYTFVEKTAAVVKTAPTAKDLTCNDSAQELVTAGEATGGTMYYALGTDSTTAPETSAYKSSIPTAINPGTYYVWYMAKGDDEHYDSTPVKMSGSVTIKPGYAVKDGNNQTWIKGSGKNLTISFKALGEVDNAYEKYGTNGKIQVNGIVVDKSNYDTSKGSLVVELKSSYLETLSVGEYKITAVFEDGEATGMFKVKEKSSSEDSSEKKSSTPKKDNVVTCQMAGYPANYAWNEAAKSCQAGYLDANGVFHSTAKATKVPNTYDKGLTANMVSLFVAMSFAFIAACLLRKY